MNEQICKRIAELNELASAKGAELIVYPEDFIDDEHLNCIWYGGHIANVKYKDMVLEIAVHGEVVLEGVYKGQDIYYCDKGNNGAVGTDLYYQVPGDIALLSLIKAGWCGLDEEMEDQIWCQAYNWVEFFLVLGDTDESFVADEDNVLEAIGEALI